MNFFFHTSCQNIKSKLSIPRFSNHSYLVRHINLYAFNIDNGSWRAKKINLKKNINWYFIESNRFNSDEIYCFCSEEEKDLMVKSNELQDLNNYTDTSPDYRSNLKITNNLGGFSSYQSEYPIALTKIESPIYSEIGLLTDSDNINQVGVFFRNVFYLPSKETKSVYLVDLNNDQIIYEFSVKQNSTNFLDLTQWKNDIKNYALLTTNISGIPIYMIEYANGSISFEHTHPPHESISGEKKFQLVSKMKKDALKKVNL